MKFLRKIIWKMTERDILLAFEFGIVLSDVARQMNREMTSEIVERAEDLLENELSTNGGFDFAMKMQVYVLAVLEPKEV